MISGGTICDGTGDEPYTADIGIKDGVIAQIGSFSEPADRTVSADGAIVTPGFVDIHTHYDAQATWANRLTPSSEHGVTTAVMGNCGVGFAPVHRPDHDRLIKLMEGVEDIPEVVMQEGLPWEWETFEEYMNYLSLREFDMDLGAQLPHAAMRVYVMGERGINREPANATDIAEMRKITEAAMKSGALGFSTSRWLHHKSSTGEHMPSLNAEADELVGIALGMKDAGRGVIQLISELEDVDAEFEIFRRMASESGRPISMSMSQDLGPTHWRKVLSKIEEANADGMQFRAQVAPRAIGLMMGLTSSVTPFTSRASYRAIADLPLDEKLRILRAPDMKRKILSEPKDAEFERLDELLDNCNWVWELDEVPDYEPKPENSLAARAQRAGMEPEDFAYERLIADGGKTLFYSARTNFKEGNFEECHEMLVHQDTVPGLGDGGAHVGLICDASFPTTMLAYWTRDRSTGPRIDLQTAVKMQTLDTAKAVGLQDRGVLKEGLKADVNVIDLENLNACIPEIVHDLPAGGKRFQQKAQGYLATVVSGAVTYENGNATGELPGRLIR